ncbi:MAG: BrnT family toxin [Treponemataceae bacterium]|nr:MAG: BrnT family toxin [Treponemataceae bacterium]
MEHQIEFDSEKAACNFNVHKVLFEDAALVFVDPMRLERRDDSESNASGEERWQTLGKVAKVLFVVYTERGDKTRIISARTATKAEKRSYYGHDNNNSKRWAKAD